MSKQLLLVRHGALEEAYDGRFFGSTDVSLSAPGRAAAEALAPRLADTNWDRRLSSPLARARETAALAFPGQRVETDPDLREVDFGLWETKTFEEIQADDPARVDAWARFDPAFSFPEGEALADWLARLNRLAGRLAADGAERIVAVTHGGVIQGLVCRFLGLPARDYIRFKAERGSLTQLELDGSSGRLIRLNDTAHLQGVVAGKGVA